MVLASPINHLASFCVMGKLSVVVGAWNNSLLESQNRGFDTVVTVLLQYLDSSDDGLALANDNFAETFLTA